MFGAFFCLRDTVLEVGSVLKRNLGVISDRVEEDAICLALVVIGWDKRHRTLRVLRLRHLVQWSLKKRLLRAIGIDSNGGTLTMRLLGMTSVLAHA